MASSFCDFDRVSRKMINLEILFLLVVFVVRSSTKCVDSKCWGTSFDSFDIDPTWENVTILTEPVNIFVVEQSRNCNLNKIKKLDFSSVEHIIIFDYGFNDFTSLSSLVLMNSTLSAMNGSWFQLINNITTLDFSWNELRMLLKSHMKNLKMLSFADFSHNDLESIELHTFSRMYYLKVLRLNDNKLKNIDIGRIPVVMEFNLNNNEIDILSSGTFIEMPKLEYLYIMNNTLRTIEAGAFTGLDFLAVLNLGYNLIEELVESTFSGLAKSKLRVLNLASNKIGRIAEGAFNDVKRLKFLFLSRNLITELNERTFEGLVVYGMLFLNDNEIETIRDNTFGNLKTLSFLNLSNNKLRRLSKGIFGTSLPLFKTLLVRMNSLTYLDSELFKPIPNIQQLDLGSNNLEYLPDNFFVPLSNLTELHIQHNSIEELTLGHVDSLNTVRRLYIDHNRLTYIPFTNNSFPDVKEVNFGGNPWQCACLDEIINIFPMNKIFYPKELYFDGKCPSCVSTNLKHCVKDIHYVRRERIADIYYSADVVNCLFESFKAEDNEYDMMDSESLLLNLLFKGKI